MAWLHHTIPDVLGLRPFKFPFPFSLLHPPLGPTHPLVPDPFQLSQGCCQLTLDGPGPALAPGISPFCCFSVGCRCCPCPRCPPPPPSDPSSVAVSSRADSPCTTVLYLLVSCWQLLGRVPGRMGRAMLLGAIRFCSSRGECSESGDSKCLGWGRQQVQCSLCVLCSRPLRGIFPHGSYSTTSTCSPSS